MRELRGTAVFLVAMIVAAMVAASLLVGCGGSVADLPHVAREITALQLDFKEADGSSRTVAAVKDPQVIAVLRDYLAAAKEGTPPEPWPWERFGLSLEYGQGGRSQTMSCEYLFKPSMPEDPGYVRFGGTWYQVPGRMNSILWSLTEYKEASGNIDPGDAAFLKKYGWTPFFRISTISVKLPAEFVHKAGDYPSVLYWAYNNELNKAIGLDLKPYLGKIVEVRLYKLAELLPEFMKPRRESGRIVMVSCEGKLVGAWLDAGRHYAFACALDGRRFEEITGKDWNGWVGSVIDPNDPIEKELSRMTPEQLIRAYFEAADKGDLKRARSMESRRWSLNYLFSNMDNNELYNARFPSDDWLSNMKKAKVLKVELFGNRAAEQPADTLLLFVETDIEYKKVVTRDSGRQPCFITLRKETPSTGWRIEGIGTGP